MPRQTVTQNRQDAHKVAKDLFLMEKPFKAEQEKREDLKAELRSFGANTYIFDGGVVTVGEPEVRTFKGRNLKLDQTKALQILEKGQIDRLVAQGVLVWEDDYSRNAVAKVEVKLT